MGACEITTPSTGNNAPAGSLKRLQRRFFGPQHDGHHDPWSNIYLRPRSVWFNDAIVVVFDDCMGARGNYQTVTKVIQAFAAQRTWSQAALARRVGVESRRIKDILTELQADGMPLQDEKDHPHVYWSVPPHWFPGGIFFDQEDWDVLLHAVLHIPDEKRRKQLLSRLLHGRILGSVEAGVRRLDQAISGLPVTSEEQKAILLVERAILEQKALSIRYFSASSGTLGWRVVSPQRLVTEPHARLAAHCHKNNTLRWFRVDNIQRADIDREAAYQEVDVDEVSAFVAASPDGFHDGTDTEWTFIVAPSAASWVRGNLLHGMVPVEDTPRGMRVATRGGALVVARFVVSLGGDAVAEAPQLKDLVRELARGAGEAQ